MSCSSCNKDVKIANSFHKLCFKCNNKRLHGSEFGKQYNVPKEDSKALKPKVNRIERKVKGQKLTTVRGGESGLGKTLNELDEDFYEECFNDCKVHECEECGKPLPDIFRDDNNKIVARFRYSHIMAKSIMPEYRHSIININHLCLEHHTQWDHGNKESMKIYKTNKNIFPWFFSK